MTVRIETGPGRSLLFPALLVEADAAANHAYLLEKASWDGSPGARVYYRKRAARYESAARVLTDLAWGRPPGPGAAP